MTGKEITVFIIGILLVGFILIMRSIPNISSNDRTDIGAETIIGISKPSNDSASEFNPKTSFPTLDIIEIPEFILSQEDTESTDPNILADLLTNSMQLENYFSPKEDNALIHLLNLLATKSDDENIELQIQLAKQQLIEVILANAAIAIDNNDVINLKQSISRLKSIQNNHQDIEPLQTKLSSIDAINKLYDKGIAQIANGEIILDNSDGAWYTAKQSLELDPENNKSITLKEQVTNILTGQALRAAEESYFEIADQQIKQAQLLDPDSIIISSTISSIESIKQQRYVWLEQQISLAISKVNVEDTIKIVKQLKDLGLGDSQLMEYQNEIERMQLYGKFKPLDLFVPKTSEKLNIPEMVVIPVGEFYMGKVNGQKHELPVHKVEIESAFAVSQNEITVQQFGEFIQETSYKTDAENNKSSRVYDIITGRMKSKSRVKWHHDYLGKRASDKDPVIHVSWNDANAYILWLNQKTNLNFRLLSEAEFEYVLRAGSYTLYPWGDGSPAQVIENITGKLDKTRNNKLIGWKEGFSQYNDGYWGPAPVASFIPNQFKLNDIAGNVMEWVADCWHDSYTRAPKNGQAWVNPGCESKVIRGGSWSSAPEEFEPSHRFKAENDFTDPRLGFRVALDL